MVDKAGDQRDNDRMKPTNREIRWQRTQAADKDAQAIIARDFSASRMNATKWREMVETLQDLKLRYRFRWVDVPDASVWMGAWLPYPDSAYFDTTTVGPFRTFTIEWLEIGASYRLTDKSEPLEQEQAKEVEWRLQQINVPYHLEGQHIRIVGYVRNG